MKNTFIVILLATLVAISGLPTGKVEEKYLLTSGQVDDNGIRPCCRVWLMDVSFNIFVFEALSPLVHSSEVNEILFLQQKKLWAVPLLKKLLVVYNVVSG